jgi:hypothetical protein
MTDLEKDLETLYINWLKKKNKSYGYENIMCPPSGYCYWKIKPRMGIIKYKWIEQVSKP